MHAPAGIFNPISIDLELAQEVQRQIAESGTRFSTFMLWGNPGATKHGKHQISRKGRLSLSTIRYLFSILQEEYPV
jgi:hypothetical protein